MTPDRLDWTMLVARTKTALRSNNKRWEKAGGLGMKFEDWFVGEGYATWDDAFEVAQEAWNYQQERIDDLKKLQAQPDKSGSFFIFGEGGNSDEYGLPEFILVCPQSGANIIAVYKRDLVGNSGQ